MEGLNPDLSQPKGKLFVDFSLFLFGLSILTYYLVFKGSTLLTLIGVFWTMFGMKGIRRYMAVNRELKRLKETGNLKEFKPIIEELKRSLGQP